MPSANLLSRIESLRHRLVSRCVDQEIEVRSRSSGDVILVAGGRWDMVSQKFVGRAKQPHVVVVKRSQEKAARQLAAWFDDYDADRPRTTLEMYADQRRGGKTFFAVLVVVLFLLRYPRKHDKGAMIGWIVVPRYPKQREIHETLRKILPSAWLPPARSYQRGPQDGAWFFQKSERFWRLPNGAELYVKSGDDAELLKEGGVPIIAVNEAQEIAGLGIINCVGNNIDSGGLTCIALNPPNKAIGLWAMNIADAIRAGHMKYARMTEFPPIDNDAINQEARGRFAEVARVIDPKQEQRDALGLWVAIGDLCYPLFSKGIHVQPEKAFAGWQDVTADINALAMKDGRGGRPWGVGMDFQGRPWCGSARCKALVAPARNSFSIPVGTLVYVVHNECTNDIAIGQWWHEERLCQEMLARGWTPSECVVIGDGTGLRQGSTARQRGREADPATFSFPLVKSFGFEIHAPLERREYIRHPRRGTEVVDTGRNPDVPVRLNLVNTLLDPDLPRLFILASCGDNADQPGGKVAESFRVCEATRAKKPTGWGAHMTDAVGYLLYRWETAWRDEQKRIGK